MEFANAAPVDWIGEVHALHIDSQVGGSGGIVPERQGAVLFQQVGQHASAQRERVHAGSEAQEPHPILLLGQQIFELLLARLVDGFVQTNQIKPRL